MGVSRDQVDHRPEAEHGDRPIRKADSTPGDQVAASEPHQLEQPMGPDQKVVYDAMVKAVKDAMLCFYGNDD